MNKMISLFFVVPLLGLSPAKLAKDFVIGQPYFSSSLSEGASLTISKQPYKTVFSLGDPFEYDGLVVSLVEGINETIIDDFFISGHHPHTLGNQAITIAYQGLQVNYEIKVTNQEAIFSSLTSEDLLFTEYVQLGEFDFAIELFNGTNAAVNLSNYEIHISDTKIVSFESINLAIGDTYVISNTNASNPVLSKSDLQRENFTWTSEDQITLVNNDAVIDIIDVNDDITANQCINGNCALINNVLKRNNKTIEKNTTFKKWQWYSLGNDVSNLGEHSLALPNLTYEQQAKAYGEYVMYGAGMFAAGRVEEAYNQLKEEYGYMDIDSKAFFLQNPNYKITGINEEGKADDSTFKEAVGRIGVLASRNGEPSFLPRVSSPSSSNVLLKNAILMALGSLFFIGVYILLKLKKIIR